VIGSDTVLWGQAVIYTIYVVAIMLLVGWFAYSITREGPSKVNPRLFYSFVGSLVVTQGDALDHPNREPVGQQAPGEAMNPSSFPCRGSHTVPGRCATSGRLRQRCPCPASRRRHRSFRS